MLTLVVEIQYYRNDYYYYHRYLRFISMHVSPSFFRKHCSRKVRFLKCAVPQGCSGTAVTTGTIRNTGKTACCAQLCEQTTAPPATNILHRHRMLHRTRGTTHPGSLTMFLTSAVNADASAPLPHQRQFLGLLH